MNRLKSYKFWVTLAGSVGLFLTSISNFIGIDIDVNGAKECIMALCGVLIVIGVVKRPNKNKQEDNTLNENDDELNKDLQELNNKDQDDKDTK